METSGSFGTTRRKRRKRLHLYLIDDDYNTFDNVIYSLQNVLPMCNALQAQNNIIQVQHNYNTKVIQFQHNCHTMIIPFKYKGLMFTLHMKCNFNTTAIH